MNYREETKRFWRVTYLMLHTKGINHLSGTKSLGEILNGEGTRGSINPQNSVINFAVPSFMILSQQQQDLNIPKVIPPGIIEAGLDMKARSNTSSMVLSFDGKKLAQGLNDEFGDEDLWGYETPNLKESKERFLKEMDEISSLEKEIKDSNIQIVSNKIVKTASNLTARVKELRELAAKQSKHLNSMLHKAGDQYKETKYAYGISKTKAQLSEIDSCILKLLKCIFSALSLICAENGSLDNYLELPYIQQNQFIYLQLVKPYTPEWENLVTVSVMSGKGVTIHDAIGLGGLKKQREYIQSMNTTSKLPPSSGTQVSMEHGISTFCKIVLPSMFPGFSFIDGGCYLQMHDTKPVVLYSPAGALYDNTEYNAFKENIHKTEQTELPWPNPVIGVEMKVQEGFPVNYTFPVNEAAFILCEMAAMGVNSLLYLTVYSNTMTVHFIENSLELATYVKNELNMMYGGTNVKHLTKISQEMKDLMHRVECFSQSNATLLCEVLLIEGEGCMSQLMFDPNEVFECASNQIKQSYELQRSRAAEVLVWLLSSTDRLWQAEIPHSVPVAYAMTSYGISCDTVRKMCDDILDAAIEREIHVSLTTFDGAFFNLATRTSEGKPLTVMQLSKSIWSQVQKLSRVEVVAILKSIKIESVECIENEKRVLSSPILQKLCNILYCAASNDPAENTDKLQSDELKDQAEGDWPEMLQSEESKDSAEGNSPEMLHTDDELKDSAEGNSTYRSHSDESKGLNAEESSIMDEKIDIQETTYERILQKYQSHKKASISGAWSQKSTADLRSAIESAKQISKLRVIELDIILSEIKDQQKTLKKTIPSMTGLSKSGKVELLSMLLGDGSVMPHQTVRVVDKVYDLGTLAANVIMKKRKLSKSPSKHLLNIICAKSIFPHIFQEWKQASTISEHVTVETENNFTFKPDFWFSQPEYSEKRHRLEPKKWDSHHLLVNNRSVCCGNGMDGLDVHKEAWIAVAEKYPDVISKPLVCDLIDKQSNAFAQRTFSEQVEKRMQELGYKSTANYCRLIRGWYQAEDEPGISSENRLKLRLEFRKFLLSKFEIDKFPPYGKHINGMPSGMFEGFLQGIDTSIQLYALVKGGAYNQRSATSLCNETFFGEMSECEQSRQGCPKATQVPHEMSGLTELLHYRHNPSDRFVICIFFSPPVLKHGGLLCVALRMSVCLLLDQN